MNLVGFVDADPKPRHADLTDLPLLGTPEELTQIVRDLRVERVVVAFSNDTADETLAAVRALDDLGRPSRHRPAAFELVGPNVKIDTLEGLPLIELRSVKQPRSARMIKRTIDVVGASALLVLTAPIFALVALAIKLDSRGPSSSDRRGSARGSASSASSSSAR